MFEPYIIFENGVKMTYSQLGELIAQDYADWVGAHIFDQLEALKLTDQFENGETPYSLPYSFSEYEGV